MYKGLVLNKKQVTIWIFKNSVGGLRFVICLFNIECTMHLWQRLYLFYRCPCYRFCLSWVYLSMFTSWCNWVETRGSVFQPGWLWVSTQTLISIQFSGASLAQWQRPILCLKINKWHIIITMQLLLFLLIISWLIIMHMTIITTSFCIVLHIN